MAYVAIRIDEGAAEMLNRYAAEKGLTKSQAIISALKDKDEADQLLDQLDAQSNDPYMQYRNLDEDELPECCQGIFSGLAKDRCEHWEWSNGGWRNKITNRYANDEKYYHYV